MSSPPAVPSGASRVVICDYNALMVSVTGLLRLSGYYVFQAYDALAAEELCAQLPNIDLLVLNTEGTATDTPGLVRAIRGPHPDLPVLHIGVPIPGMPSGVAHLAESFTAEQLLATVEPWCTQRRPSWQGCHRPGIVPSDWRPQARPRRRAWGNRMGARSKANPPRRRGPKPDVPAPRGKWEEGVGKGLKRPPPKGGGGWSMPPNKKGRGGR